jgi:hypothetical protein
MLDIDNATAAEIDKMAVLAGPRRVKAWNERQA